MIILKFPSLYNVEDLAPPSSGRAEIIPFPARDGGGALSRAERDGCEPGLVPGEATSATGSAPAGSRGRPSSAKEAQRKNMLAKIHVGLNKLYAALPGFCEDTYRFFLRERWGVDSAAKLDIPQLDEVLHWQAELGFQSSHPHYARRDYRRMGTSALVAKINALLSEKGQKEGCFIGLDYAEGILRNMTKKAKGGPVTDLRLATPAQLRGVIAALTGDARRKGRGVR